MPSDKPERRSNQRISARLPLTLNTPNASLKATGHTRDLSSNGIFFYTDFPIEPGNDVEMVLILPPELTNGGKRWVCCHATVMRVESNSDGSQRGVAAKLRNMEVLPELG
jgi:hypothetical protein